MAENSVWKNLSKIGRKSDLAVALSVLLVVMLLIIPLPSFILDFLMVLNITLSLLVVLIVLYTPQALEFTVFPTLLLVSTVFGLALNVSSTRLILSQGSLFNGRIVRAFANFVVGARGAEGLVIGFIIFIILVAVQFIVITKGSTRVAEVAARFTLDSLPGKQMAIEAEFNSGAMSEEDMARKKMELEKEVDFYGAMDGASKFVSGNVKVGILITIVNIIGGLIVGLTIHQETLAVATQTYISLTIGDGLVAQIPSLLISTGTGLIVTRAVSEGTFGDDIITQFSRQSRVYFISSAFLFFLAFLPGFPWYILFPLSGLSGFLAWRLYQRQKKEHNEQEKVSKTVTEEKDTAIVATLDPLSLEIGYALVPLVDQSQGAELLERITSIRREIALELGVVIPRIRIVDNMRLEPSEYSVKIRGVEIARGLLRVGRYLAINPGNASEDIEGEKTTEPTFGLPALWVAEDQRRKAERSGYTVVDSPSIITTHLTELIRRNASEILGRQEVRNMLDALKGQYSAVIDDVLKHLSTAEIHKILQSLLAEKVSIRNIVTILESISDFSLISKESSFLTEKARQSLARQICSQYTDDNKRLFVMTLSAELEELMISARQDTAQGPMVSLAPDVASSSIQAIHEGSRVLYEHNHTPIVLCSEAVRPLLRSLMRSYEIVLLSAAEIVPGITVESLHVVSIGSKKVAV